MSPIRTGNVLNWASDIDAAALDQAQCTAALPFVAGHVALMPDAHVGMGATIGSVIPTAGAIIPSAVGVDIGCGMVAVELPLDSASLGDAWMSATASGSYCTPAREVSATSWQPHTSRARRGS